jgi:hypothetical protein
MEWLIEHYCAFRCFELSHSVPAGAFLSSSVGIWRNSGGMHNLVPDMWPLSPILQLINKVSHWKTLLQFQTISKPIIVLVLLLHVLFHITSANSFFFFFFFWWDLAISISAMVVRPGFQEPIIPFLSDCGLWTVAEFLVSPTFTCIGHQLVLDGEHSDLIGSCLTHPWERLVQHRCRQSCQIWSKTAGHFLTRYST